MSDFLRPDWPAPENVKALCTTRLGGVSVAPFDRFNLASHVGDDAAAVASNRDILVREANMPAAPQWLEQVHGTAVARFEQTSASIPCADAATTHTPGVVLSVLTADCLPVLFCDQNGEHIGVAHAGWRGLVAGIIERTLADLVAMAGDGREWLVWLGPAIGPRSFEVGDEVRAQFVAHDANAVTAFSRGAAEGKWFADLYELARQRLATSHERVSVHGGGLCTYRDAQRFYSYRRESRTGRMATCIWMQ